ncbi:MAG TPA: hypothetical protein VGJ84_12425 [Polyangiaceae bacterium]|jgi:hypothetical protein
MTKRKLSLTVAEDVLLLLDRAAERSGATRSAMVDRWLRRAARSELEDQLRLATIEYYDSLTVTERAEQAAIAQASSRAARRVSIEDSPRSVLR